VSGRDGPGAERLTGLSITPVILTYNEEPNIGRQLARLSWARRVVVVDSLSTDKTRDLCEATPNVDLFVRPFDTHAQQWNFAIQETQLDTEWVLAMDADYIPSDEFLGELAGAVADPRYRGYRCHFQYVSLGRRLRGSLYPPVVCLFRRDGARYRQDGHTQRLVLAGAIGEISAPIMHDDRKPLSRWVAAQQRYAALEAEQLLASDWVSLSRRDRLRLMSGPAPFLVLAYVLVVKGCLFEGPAGWFYAFQRLVAEVLLAMEILERRVPAVREPGAGRIS
jgi:glycosyltransferase involved in cell wall biosynthesis